MPNTLHVIHPYRDLSTGLWVFDDDSRGLEREPFVPVTTHVIDALLAEQGLDGSLSFGLLFGAAHFPGAHVDLERVGNGTGPEEEGTWYEVRVGERVHELWLCPALLRYFPDGPPARLFAQVVESPDERTE